MLDPSHAWPVADRFALGTPSRLVGPVAFGRLGEIWRLDTDRGSFAVKQARVAPEPDRVARDAAYQEQAQAAGIPMPAVVRTGDGQVLGNVAGTPVRVYTWVDVLAAERGLDPVQVGAVVAGIHGVRVPPHGPADPWYVAPVGAPSWRDLVTRLRSAGAPFADRLESLISDVIAVEALLVDTAPVQVCHRDLWADNLRRCPRGGLVVLDWENSGPGVPAGELAVIMFEFGLGDPDRMRELHAAYIEAGGPARLRTTADLTMLIAQTGHIAETGCERWLDATTDEERVHNAAWVSEFLDEPVTLRTVEMILDAAG